MTTLIARAMVLQNNLGLDEEKLAVIQHAMRTYAADMMNNAKVLIEKRESPDMIRKYMEPHGLTYDGTKKLFK